MTVRLRGEDGPRYSADGGSKHMKRTWVVRPDTDMQLRDGSLIEFVSREAAVEGFMDALSIGDRAGGVVEIVFGRVGTDVDGEMLTSGIAFRWKDRVDATTSPERPSTVVPKDEAFAPVYDRVVNTRTGEEHPVEAVAGTPVSIPADPTPEELEAQLEGEEQARAAHADSPDGLDPGTLEEEDTSSIPAEMR